MLDPLNDFNSPCYDDTFRRNYFFKEYKNFTEYFIELDYWIMREAFVSRIGATLNLDQTHYDGSGNGGKIFRDVSTTELATFAARGYFLGDETIDAGTSKFGDIYHVTELYVYAPMNGKVPAVFKSWNSEVVNYPKLVDFDFAYSRRYETGEMDYLSGLDEIGFESEDLDIGDEFFIERPEQNPTSMSTLYACRSAMLSVYRREGAKVWAKAAQFVNPYSGNTYPAKDVVGVGYSFVKCNTKTYAERSLQVAVRKETRFYLEQPEILEKWFPKNNIGTDAGQVDSGTNPTFSDYRQMMENPRWEINPQPSNIEQIYKGLWRREDFFAPYK